MTYDTSRSAAWNIDIIGVKKVFKLHPVTILGCVRGPEAGCLQLASCRLPRGLICALHVGLMRWNAF